MVEEHVHRTDAYLCRLIRRHARSLCRMVGFSVSDREDLEQDLWVHLLRKQDRFDPSLASFETFADRVLTNRVRSLLRHRRALKRCPEREVCSLADTLPGLEDETSPRSETLAGPDLPAPRDRDLKQDVDALAEHLDEQSVSVLMLLRQGCSQNRIASLLTISRRQVRNAVRRIKEAAIELEIYEYCELTVQPRGSMA